MPFAQAGDIRMHYEERGEGPETILFVHGWTGSWLNWSPVLDALPPGFRGIAVDLRGAGDTDKPGSGYTIKQYSDDLYAFTQALGLKDFTFVGHSMGGAITYQFVVDHPEVLKAAAPSAATAVDGYAGWSAEAIADIRANRTNRDHHLARTRAGLVRPVAEELIADGVDQALRVSDGHVFDSIDSMRDLRLGDRLAGTNVPMLFLGGDRDADIPVAMVVRDWQRVPGAHLQMFYRASHAFPRELPGQFVTAVTGFVQSL